MLIRFYCWRFPREYRQRTRVKLSLLLDASPCCPKLYAARKSMETIRRFRPRWRQISYDREKTISRPWRRGTHTCGRNSLGTCTESWRRSLSVTRSLGAVDGFDGFPRKTRKVERNAKELFVKGKKKREKNTFFFSSRIRRFVVRIISVSKPLLFFYQRVLRAFALSDKTRLLARNRVDAVSFKVFEKKKINTIPFVRTSA